MTPNLTSHQRNLATLLRMQQHAGPSERKKLAQTLDPQLRELLLDEEQNDAALVPAEMYKTVIEGADQMKCVRNIFPIFSCKSNSMTVPIGGTTATAPEVAEGTEIPISQDTYTGRTFTVKKYGMRPTITRELVDDGNFDLIALEVAKSGKAIENALNAQVLNCLLDNAGNEHDTAATNTGLIGLNTAYGKNTADHFVSDNVLLHPLAAVSIGTSLVPSGGYYPLGNYAEGGNNGMGTLLGMKTWLLSVDDSTTSYIWDYDTDGDIGMLLVKADAAAAIAMRQDIRVERFNDPIKDLMSAAVTMRFGTNYLNANAICRVEY